MRDEDRGRGEEARTGAARRRLALWWGLMALVAGLCGAGYRLMDLTLGGYVRTTTRLHGLGILTWNIGKLYLRWDSRASDRDLEHVARVIQEAGPMVVALQELRDPQQLGQLLTLLGPAWHGKVPRDIYDRHAGLLTRLPAEFFNLSTTTGRVAQGAVITHPDGFRFVAASVHLDAFDPERRRLQLEEILARVGGMGHQSIFLCGDFNLDPALAARGSRDQQLYSFLVGELQDAAKYAGPTTMVSRRLDYVFYRSTRVKRHTAGVLQGRRVGMMDHNPLLVTFSL